MCIYMSLNIKRHIILLKKFKRHKIFLYDIHFFQKLNDIYLSYTTYIFVIRHIHVIEFLLYVVAFFKQHTYVGGIFDICYTIFK